MLFVPLCVRPRASGERPCFEAPPTMSQGSLHAFAGAVAVRPAPYILGRRFPFFALVLQARPVRFSDVQDHAFGLPPWFRPGKKENHSS